LLRSPAASLVRLARAAAPKEHPKVPVTRWVHVLLGPAGALRAESPQKPQLSPCGPRTPLGRRDRAKVQRFLGRLAVVRRGRRVERAGAVEPIVLLAQRPDPRSLA